MVALREYLKEVVEAARKAALECTMAAAGVGSVPVLLEEKKAQGTTEYAILVGVLVVIAIVAIVAFKDKVSELWTSISDGINSL